MLIGVTGAIGSGKSMVARMLGEMLPAPVFSSDEICQRLLEKGESGYHAFVAAWGNRFLAESGEINRVLLRSAVFDNSDIRNQLEKILHPLVRQTLLDVKRECTPQTIKIAEVPLLFECGWQADFDGIVCVVADREAAVQRVVERDSVKRADVEKILDVQMDPAHKAEQSNWVIDNSSNLETTTKQVTALAGSLHEMASRYNSR